MAYARISDDCDVYVYKDWNGIFHVHVRHIWPNKILYYSTDALVSLYHILMGLSTKGYRIPNSCFRRIQKERVRELIDIEIANGKRKTNRRRT